MSHKISLVVTSIAGSDNKVLRSLAAGCATKEIPFIVIGDSKSPADFSLDACDFYSLSKQKQLPFSIATLIPERRYSRKNIGYLLAAANGSDIIIETDDDNYALDDFWGARDPLNTSYKLDNSGWVNVYGYFSKAKIWPRGFALEHLQDALPVLNADLLKKVNSPIQQGLANENPDVDALYRLILPLPINFEDNDNISIGHHSWCPFNSQNTTWFREAFLLLYLPTYCSFRMTDIWRSFVAQRICWENDWHILFHKATVWQERNDHNLMKDMEDEISGYLNNKKIATTLENLSLKKGKENIGANLGACYESLINLKLIDQKEMELLNAWLTDMGKYII